MKLKVFYDFQIMLMQKYGGISRYYYELLSNINKNDNAEAKSYCIGSINSYFENYFGKCNNLSVKRGLSALNRLIASTKMNHYDIIHPTYYDPYVLKHRKKKLVITVYDMIHELFPGMFPEDKTAENKKRMIYESDHIIAISQSTKNDILKIYPDVPEDKISVIYIGSNVTENKNETDVKLPGKFILFVGRRENYKNFNLFFNSVKSILTENKDLYLVCLGGDSFKQEELSMISNVREQVLQFNVNDALLAILYRKALCFVFPSLYEGFGIPTLEAFYCDCPVVLSNTSSMPEVGGDAVVYFNPYDVRDMEEKIRMVIGDEQLRKEMISKGQKQLLKFDWVKIANQTIDCYINVLNKG